MSSLCLIRADGNSRMGTGHVMRCLSLAQGWRRCGEDALFALADATPALEQRLTAEGMKFVRFTATPGSDDDAAQTIAIARQRNALFVVADGYSFDAPYQRAIKSAGLRLLLVDDYGHTEQYHADLILNQNLSAREELYQHREPDTRLLLGTRYVLLREQFLPYRNWQRYIAPVANKVLVTLGGTDPDNVTHKVIEALKLVPDIEAVVVVGGSNLHRSSLQTISSNLPASFRLVVDTSNMPELMAWADVAVAAAGSTAWELAFMGLPSLLLVLAENQQPVADSLTMAGIAKKSEVNRIVADLCILLADESGRQAMSQHGRQAVDGDGVRRVATWMRTPGLALRRMQPSDSRLTWEWANDPETRAASFSSEPIPWETHAQWFTARVNSPACLFYLASDNHNAPVGQIRYDIKETEAVVSISLEKKARGRGYGTALIMCGSTQCFADSPVRLIRAFVKPDNGASVQAFLKAGFSEVGNTEASDPVTRQFVQLRQDMP